MVSGIRIFLGVIIVLLILAKIGLRYNQSHPLYTTASPTPAIRQTFIQETPIRDPWKGQFVTCNLWSCEKKTITSVIFGEVDIETQTGIHLTNAFITTPHATNPVRVGDGRWRIKQACFRVDEKHDDLKINMEYQFDACHTKDQ